LPVGFFEQHDGEFPHPDIPLPVLLIVEQAVAAAWEHIHNHPQSGFSLMTAVEDVVTLALHEVLVDTLLKNGTVPGFDRALIQNVEREAKIHDFNYAHPDKMPDLVVRLVGRPHTVKPTQDGVFIECKPVDARHKVLTHYCKKGIQRFIVGEYAWTLLTGVMVAYVRPSYKIDPDLTKTLRNWAGVALERCQDSPGYRFAQPVHISTHSRKFKYKGSSRQAPDVTIRHLWLDC